MPPASGAKGLSTRVTGEGHLPGFTESYPSLRESSKVIIL